ncbi:hypothetical protein TNCV_2967961 [Trichonephila clavipes]|nr:hypothetical protein TNCV_2967961 [Trichonephila clavipes]
MNIQSVEAQSPHVGVEWKFGKWSVNSGMSYKSFDCGSKLKGSSLDRVLVILRNVVLITEPEKQLRPLPQITNGGSWDEDEELRVQIRYTRQSEMIEGVKEVTQGCES